MTTILKHASLGEFHGREKDSAIQFLGIKYASVKSRFAASEVFPSSPTPGSVHDCTKFGPIALNPPDGLKNEFGFIQNSLPAEDIPSSDLDGLNLNVTVPVLHGKLPREDAKLPVFVFIHGGGFALGANSWPHYDQAKLVKLGVQVGNAVIGVGINYRLGIAGFLTSTEMREAGYLANNGLRDQQNAFRWVKKFIAGFGGDPENVTFIGESAGSVAGCLLLHSSEPLFKRYISMSGTTLLMQPLPPHLADFVYSTIIEALGIQHLSGPERIKALVELPAEKLVTLVPHLPLHPIVDGDFISGTANFAQTESKEDDPAISIPGRKWCKDLLIGDCQFDASICSFMLGPRVANIAAPFCASATKTLGANAPVFLSAYHLSPDLPDSVALRRVLQYASDACFSAPVVAFATGWPGKSYVYAFNEGNPWDGEWKGEASHVLDLAYLFQNFNDKLTVAQRDVAEKFAGDVLAFIAGKWTGEAFGEGKGGVTVYGPSEKGVCAAFVEGKPGAEGTGRSKVIFELAEKLGGMDVLAKVWSDFFTGGG